MTTIYMKNTTGSDKTWVGQVVGPAAYHLLGEWEKPLWAFNDAVLADIGSGEAIISRSGDSSGHIVGVSDAISYLRGDLPASVNIASTVTSSTFRDTSTFTFRGKGVSGTITAGTTGTISHKLTEDRFIEGLQILLENQASSDGMSLRVVDVDNILGYGPNVILSEFVTGWCVDTSRQNQGIFTAGYPAKIPANLYLHLVYVSTGATNVTLRCNLFLHKKVVV